MATINRYIPNAKTRHHILLDKQILILMSNKLEDIYKVYNSLTREYT
ncbi:14329_t:CDS:2 [Acaulospora colombiana]|uniref:14329_t:CDS:1 n=1 Tax=Acaulospora colombiana TaxID=27376 RepID=A0ACA9KB21_9GLOM|nr:14329_t:CDS:2 [Acaulospora colombiana]